MDIQTLTEFFMICTLINSGFLLLWSIIYKLMPDVVYRLQSMWFPISRETFDISFYAFLAMFKIFVIVFCFVPWMALLIMG
jgi:hypothetical protein